eukprot:GHVO01007361.1.p2 GENE.GHVO01007361.1~~GHVO01007361.1.p2  ORF type:complete len:163 (+),score=5.87 GHVO01007361.1:60-548(+)
MNLKNKNLKLISKELYPFSFILLADDLQASQLVIDSFGTLLVNETSRAMAEDICSNEATGEYINLVRLEVFKASYIIGRKRFQQVKDSIDVDEKYKAFFTLEFSERVILYLKQKTNFDLKEISYITEMNLNEVSNHIAVAREKLANCFGKTTGESLFYGKNV